MAEHFNHYEKQQLSLIFDYNIKSAETTRTKDTEPPIALSFQIIVAV